MKDKRKVFVMILLAFVGILLVCVSGFKGEGEPDVPEQTLDEYKHALEAELEDVCSLVEGVGRCRVSISFEKGAENSYKGSLLTESRPPKVLGVSVVCQGAGSDAVRAALTEMISALYGIGTNRVAVLKMQN